MINAARIHEIFIDCLFREEELKDGKPVGIEPVIVEGILSKIGFHPQRVQEHTREIGEILRQLPESFHKTKGGGMSFLEACMDREGHQWGEHLNVEQLLALGLASDQAGYGLSRRFWEFLPGGMPYFWVQPTSEDLNK